MLMARSSHRLLCSTNNELLCGASFAKMPLFESTGVGRRQRSLKGMVLSRPRNRTARLGVGNIAGTDKIYAVTGVGSVATCTRVAGVSTVAFGAVAALSFGFGDTFFVFGLGAAFRALDFRVAFFAVFTWTGRFLAGAAAVAFWRFTGAVGFAFFARAFFALSSCQRFFWAAAIRFRAATLNRFLPVAFGSALAVAVEMDRLESPWPNSAWISAMAASIRFRCIS